MYRAPISFVSQEEAPASVLVPGLSLPFIVIPCLVWMTVLAPDPALPTVTAVTLTPSLPLALVPAWGPVLMTPILAPA